MKTIKTTVKDVDLKRYMGKWYEIARYENRFERDMQAVTAEYTLEENGRVKVDNQGHKNSIDGPLKRSIGKAKMPNPQDPGKLKVSFFLWFYADYYILDLDEEKYSYALVGSSKPDYLWILSRTPKMDSATLQHLLEKAATFGYDTTKLIFVKH